MRKLFVVLMAFMLLTCVSYAYDLFDLRIIPSYTTGRLQIDGYISNQKHTKDGSRRRDRLRSMYPEWLTRGKVTIRLTHGTYECNVVKGLFSTEILTPTTEHISIYFKKQELYSEPVNFPINANYLIVSDIDDTILESSIGNLAKMAYKAMCLTAKDRTAVEGTAELYQTLQRGKSTLGSPLFTYLSGSPSALSRSVKSFLKINGFPYGVTIFKKSFWSSDTPFYKLKWLKNLAMKFKGYPMILFGDSGEKDPFIYSSFVSQNPNIVKGVVIHEVTGRASRIDTLKWYKKKCNKLGIPYIVWSSEKELREKMLAAGLLTR